MIDIKYKQNTEVKTVTQKVDKQMSGSIDDSVDFLCYGDFIAFSGYDHSYYSKTNIQIKIDDLEKILIEYKKLD